MHGYTQSKYNHENDNHIYNSHGKKNVLLAFQFLTFFLICIHGSKNRKHLFNPAEKAFMVPSVFDNNFFFFYIFIF